MALPTTVLRPAKGFLEVSVSLPLNGDCVDQVIFIAPAKCVILGASEVHAVAGNDAGAVSLQLTKDTGTDAPGAGTDLLTNNSSVGFDLKGAANTVQESSLVVAQSSLVLQKGNRLSLDFAGTVTTLSGAAVTVWGYWA